MEQSNDPRHRVRIGVVGLGFMGSTHLRAYQAIPEAEIVAVASSSRRKLSGDLSGTAGNLPGSDVRVDFSSAARYLTADELISDPRVEAVDLCVPTHLHRPLTEEALAAGKHVLVEKPMALSVEECRSMLEQAHQQGKVLMVAQVLRFWPDYAAARELVSSGAVGRVMVAHFSRRCAPPSWGDWLSDPERSGGGAFDLLIHDFDFCVALFGPPRSIRAVGLEDLPGGTDYLQAELGFDEHRFVTVSGGWMPGEYPFAMGFSISGQRGTLDYHSDVRRLTLFRSDGPPEDVSLTEVDGFQNELQAFVEACSKGVSPPQCPPEESALAVEVALAALRSRQQQGESIDL